LFEISDVLTAKAFVNSTDAREKMQAAGVIGIRAVVLLSENYRLDRSAYHLKELCGN
jgi:hypothetical protein